MKSAWRTYWHLYDAVQELWSRHSEMVGFMFYVIATLLAISMLWVALDAAEGCFR